MKTLPLQQGYRLDRERTNYPSWRRNTFDLLQASGVEAAITPEFAKLSLDSDVSDSPSSEEDSDDGLSKRLEQTLSLADSLTKGELRQQSRTNTRQGETSLFVPRFLGYSSVTSQYSESYPCVCSGSKLDL